LCLYILNKLVTKTDIDKKILADLIVKTSHTVRNFPKRLEGADLSKESLSHVYLSNSDLSNADLGGASLRDTYPLQC
jgi:uncharacterized protein YjbI with pentapeptide repeats